MVLRFKFRSSWLPRLGTTVMPSHQHRHLSQCKAVGKLLLEWWCHRLITELALTTLVKITWVTKPQYSLLKIRNSDQICFTVHWDFTYPWSNNILQLNYLYKYHDIQNVVFIVLTVLWTLTHVSSNKLLNLQRSRVMFTWRQARRASSKGTFACVWVHAQDLAQ